MNVCIVIPVYKNIDTIDSLEWISLKQGLTILKQHVFCLIGPKSIEWEGYRCLFREYDVQLQVKTFPNSYFNDVGGYSRLLLSPVFYRSFSEYQYILIYQLDAFIFRDDLLGWCKKGFDYIGAPWFEGFSSTNANAAFASGGNGGFSLRRIKSHLKVLHSFSYINPPLVNWRQRMAGKRSIPELIKQFCGFLLDLTVRNNTYSLLNSFKGYEDQFWCLVAGRNFSWYTFPDSDEAMNFAIEMQPRRVYEMNGSRLPVGCHAWWKYDFEFWKPHIEAAGYQL